MASISGCNIQEGGDAAYGKHGYNWELSNSPFEISTGYTSIIINSARISDVSCQMYRMSRGETYSGTTCTLSALFWDITQR